MVIKLRFMALGRRQTTVGRERGAKEKKNAAKRGCRRRPNEKKAALGFGRAQQEETSQARTISDAKRERERESSKNGEPVDIARKSV